MRMAWAVDHTRGGTAAQPARAPARRLSTRKHGRKNESRVSLAARSGHGVKMIPLVSEAIQNYADAFSTMEPELFAELARETRATQKDPQMMVGNSAGLLLRFLVMITRARRVLEIGPYTGYSALAMASGLPGHR